ncbi:hypothetical protein, conserved [Babesia ovata]|uniref:C3H1-type domain-containing protein n=1 Tax=Babesia ovata TaxID=189622 RepID=A0A2H6K860_9APIC|nr:uncharacterized protein BOVATA_006630 [Babesia ovata]GBE59170.1 hypothetical protein, conserved [Babesia ovata]
MAPKKLTDCPENLRESIDWLIQVRHGNGEHGLKNLANALQRLIQKAIDDATNSLDKRRKELECPPKHWETTSYCTEKQNSIKDIETKIKELKSKDPQPTNDLNVHKSQLSMFKKEKDDHFNEVHYLTEDARNRALGDITERQNKLKDLQKELEAFIGKQEVKDANEIPAKGILENLCSGLQTFLGYDETSKGYSGEGIVYSDLDRLCDGVMAFLQGVLDTVKDDNVVTNYVVSPDLNSVLDTLTKNIGTGRKGLSDSVDSVKGWLGKYNEEVGKKTQAVTGPLRELKREIDTYKRTVETMRSDEVSRQHDKWKEQAEMYSEQATLANNALQDLDDKLKDTLRYHVDILLQAVKSFKRMADKDDMVKVLEQVEDHRQKITDHFQNVHDTAERTVKGFFAEVDRNMGELGRLVGLAGEAITNAEQKLDTLIKDAGKAHNLAHLKGKTVKILDGEIKAELESAVTRLTTAAGTPMDEVFNTKIKGVLTRLVEKINEAIKALGGEFKELNKQNNDTINAIVGHIREKIEKIKGNSGGRAEGLARAVDNVQKYADKFKEGKEGFETIVEGWLRMVLEKDGMSQGLLYGNVKGCIAKYVGVGESYFKHEYKPGKEKGDEIIQVIKKKITEKLKKIRKDLIQESGQAVTKILDEVTDGTTDKIQKYIRAVKDGCDHFSTQLGIKIEEKEFMDSFALEIAKAIETDKDGLFDSHPSPTDDPNLIDAVRIALVALYVTAKQATKVLDNFALDTNRGGTSIAGTVQGAYDKAETLYGYLQKALGQPAGSAGGTNHAAEVDQAIKGVSDEVGKLNDTFAFYVKHALDDAVRDVTQPLGDLKDFASELNGSDGLPKLVKQLEVLKTGLENGTGADGLKALIGKCKQANQEAKGYLDKQLTDGINKAKQYAEEYIKVVAKKVIQMVSEASAQINNTAKQEYSQSMEKEFTLLKEIVDNRRNEIENDIYFDSISVMKGLLKEMNNNIIILDTLNSKVDFVSRAIRISPFLTKILDYVRDDTKKTDPNFEGISNVNVHVKSLFVELSHIKHFSHEVSNRLSMLSEKVHNLQPQDLPDAGRPVLTALKDGMEKFIDHLQKHYVSRYSMQQWQPEEGEKYAKVCLTIMETVFHELYWLRRGCSNKNNHNKQIILADGNKLGAAFKKHGFDVSKDAKTQNGELKRDRNAGEIHTLLVKSSNDGKHLYTNDDEKEDAGPLKTFHVHLEEYFQVSHHRIPPKPKSPSNIYEMLQWLSGLRWNTMYNKLQGHFTKMFEELMAEYKLHTEALPVAVPPKMSETIKSPLTASHLNNELRKVCSRSHQTLIAILGHGHTDGIYACDYFNNSNNFLYPGSASSCFDTLVEIINLLYPQMCFLYKMCINGPSSSGWAECQYGRYVGGSDWLCNNKQCANQKCKLNANLSANQRADQTCDQHPNCGVKSPLQSFLEDGLQGFLPHSFTSPGCKLTCTVTNHFGKPCLTPMGFVDIGVAASHTKTGGELKEVLFDFCGDASKPLSTLCIVLNGLLRRPPQTLGDMFAFYHVFLQNYSREGTKHRITAFKEAVKKAYFGNEYTALTITAIQQTKSHDHSSNSHQNGDLYTLVECNNAKSSNIPSLPCGSYLQPLTLDARSMSTEKHADYYLSWIVYVTGTFYDLLKTLYEECCNNCNKPGTRCYDKCCVEKCPVKGAYVAEEPSKKLSTAKHTSECHSIVKCQKTHPTLYKYGFTFESPHKLSGNDGIEKQRSCIDFCKTLEKVIGDGCLLVKLIKDIDDFIWEIRQKFSITLLALWSLSLLYLLHITVVRLDVLRIRSHLKSPSSHRIAAQSLLAAARVKALANVKYFSP